MPNYQNGKIYKLVNIGTNMFYIGSTCNELRVRFSQHKTYTNKGINKTTSSLLFEGGEPVQIELIENFACNSRNELERREYELIRDNPECVNFMNGRSLNPDYMKEYYAANKDKAKEYYAANKDIISEQKKSYYEANKDIILQKHKEYHEANKGIIREKNKTYYVANKDKAKDKAKEYYAANKDIILKKITCDICKCDIRKKDFTRHERTAKHLKNISNNAN